MTGLQERSARRETGMEYEFTGALAEIGETQTFNGRKGEFRKRAFTLEAQGESRWPERMFFELQNDSVRDIDGCRKGQTLTVRFRVDCRTWTHPQTGRVSRFISLIPTRVAFPAEDPIPLVAEPPATAMADGGDETEDLPF